MLLRQSFDNRFIFKIKELEEKYGKRMFDIDGIGSDVLDINIFTKNFLDNNVVADLSTDPNANVDDDSVIAYENEFNKSIHRLNAYYILWEQMVKSPELGIKRANKALEACINGTLKLHDQHLWLKSYCYAFSLEPVVRSGLTYIKKVRILPPKHVSSFINQVIQFLAYASNQIAGAAAFPDFFMYLDWYCRLDYGEDYLTNEESRKKLEQELQSLIFSMGYPYRSSQSAFSNLSIFDKYFLKDLFENNAYPDFSKPNIESIIKLQEFYARWFVEESKTQTFTFPVNTVCFYVDEKTQTIPDKEFLDLISELNSYNGAFNIYTGALGSIASCCRLRNNVKSAYTNSFGAGGVSIGSHRVVTINFPRLAYEAEDEKEFMSNLEYNVLLAQDILQIHRELLLELIEKKKLPLYTHKYMDLSKQFSTIGFIGVNEACEILKISITEKSGQDFAVNALTLINTLNTTKAKKTNTIWNMEQIPGESAAFQFANKDKLLFSTCDYEMYSNQYIPLWENVDILERIKIAGIFDSLCSGGAIAHITCSDALTKNQMKQVIEYTAKCGVIYFAINISQCRCMTCGKLFIGKFEKSPCHNAPVQHYLRVVGYLVPVSSWNKHRREEYTRRQFYHSSDIKI